MRIIQRYLLGELLLNAAFTLLVLSSVIAMLVFSIAALKMSMSTLGIADLIEVVALLSATQLGVILPLTVLIATLWTYGRAQADGELTAMRGAGIHLYHLLLPALVLGAAVTLVLAWIQDEIIPESHYQQAALGKRHLAKNIEGMLLDEKTSIQDGSFKCRWEGLDLDEEGHYVLREVVVVEMKGDDHPAMVTRAKSAVPVIDLARGELVLTLRDFIHGDVLSSEKMTVKFNLRALSEEPPHRRKTEDKSYQDLLVRARQMAGTRDGRKATTEFHKRAATAFSAFAFALLGTGLGVVLRITNRAVVFSLGFALVLLLHYAPTLVGVSLAKSGSIPPIPALWSGVATVTVLAMWTIKRAFRR